MNIFKRIKISFNKKKTREQVKETEIQIKEVPVYSRFTFAHDNVSIPVKKYFINKNVDMAGLQDIEANQIFMLNDISIIGNTYKYIGNNKFDFMDEPIYFYPIFRMPEELPKTKLISINKIMCIGTIITNIDGEILYTSSHISGLSLSKIYEKYSIHNELTTSRFYSIMKPEIFKYEVVDGPIDLNTFSRFSCLNFELPQYLNN